MSLLTKLPRSVLHWKIGQLDGRHIHKWINPMLSMEKRATKVQWMLVQVIKDGRRSIFRDHRYTVHLDKKRIYAMKDNTKTWLLPTDDNCFLPMPKTRDLFQDLRFWKLLADPPTGMMAHAPMVFWGFSRSERRGL